MQLAPLALAKVAYACLPGDTMIDSPTGPRKLATLEAGDVVTGYDGGPVRILQKHSYLENANTPFFRIRFTDGACVECCGKHRVAGVPAASLRLGQSIAGREVFAITQRSGLTRSYDLLTEDKGYQVNGIPVNSMIEEMRAATTSR
jgi:hypothetical protein